MGSTAIVNGSWAPGNRTPLAGLTCIQDAPAIAAVKDSGEPLVDSRIDCDAGGEGGATNAIVVALTVSVGNGAEVTYTMRAEITQAGRPEIHSHPRER